MFALPVEKQHIKDKSMWRSQFAQYTAAAEGKVQEL